MGTQSLDGQGVNPMKEIKFTLAGTANHDGVGDRSKRGFLHLERNFVRLETFCFIIMISTGRPIVVKRQPEHEVTG